MFSLSRIVRWVIYALVCVAVLGLLWWLIGYVESQLPTFPLAFQIIRVVFVVCVVLMLIYFLLSFTMGGPGGPDGLFKPCLLIPLLIPLLMEVSIDGFRSAQHIYPC